MIEARLTELNKDEVLRGLAYGGQKIDPALAEQIDRAMADICRIAQPKLVYLRQPLTVDPEAGSTSIASAESSQSNLAGLPLSDLGQDGARLLAGCQEVLIVAATLGARIDVRIQRAEVMDMTEALILDACASVAIENVMDHFQADLRLALAKELADPENQNSQTLFAGDRFSPGYGDMPLSLQCEIVAMLNAERRIGLTVNEGGILIPRKSVMAIIGIAEDESQLTIRGCGNCSLKESCEYRKSRKVCYGK